MTQYADMINKAALSGALAQKLDLLSARLKAEAALLRLDGKEEEAQAREADAETAAEGAKSIDDSHFSQIAGLIPQSLSPKY